MSSCEFSEGNEEGGEDRQPSSWSSLEEDGRDEEGEEAKRVSRRSPSPSSGRSPNDGGRLGPRLSLA